MLNFSNLFFKFISLILGISDTVTFPPPLSAEEERRLFSLMKEGDGEARARLIEHNMRLVSHIIRKYYASYQYPDDLLSVGSLGLIKAVDSFKAEKGIRFATFGARCIQNEILMFFRSRKHSGLEVSLNDTIDVDRDGNPLTYLDIISAPEHIAEDIDMNMHIEKIRRLVDTVLDERQREIIVLRYGLMGYQPKTQREVAAYLGISRSYVSRIEKKALLILKDSFGSVRPEFDD
ncbi:MAG: RNA polymerase sporulation sigma factor SigK [Clostridia bacterium]|nr:RNA polymerase sporulation sigma factor SigK [Clostridia bacterium]